MLSKRSLQCQLLKLARLKRYGNTGTNKTARLEANSLYFNMVVHKCIAKRGDRIVLLETKRMENALARCFTTPGAQLLALGG